MKNPNPTKFFVVMKNGNCVYRTDPIGANALYAYTSRTWAEKCATKNQAEVKSVQGLDLLATFGLHWDWESHKIECHFRIMEEAMRLFGSR